MKVTSFGKGIMTRITILTLGSRGDVQPYIALGVGLKRAGFEVILGTGRNFESFVRDHGLTYGYMDADFLELMQDPQVRRTLEGRGNPVQLMRRAFEVLRHVLDDSWAMAQGSEALVYHPKITGGASIAEKLGIPGFVALPIPMLTATGDFPNILIPQRLRLGRWFNRQSHAAFNRIMYAPYRRMVNRWRKDVLGLPPLGLFALERQADGEAIPALYPFSRHVIPPPADWPPSAHVTGYWFLDAQPDWQPPRSLVDFLNAGPAPVYIGFGSMIWNDPAQAARNVIDALAETGQRGILAKGWGGLSAADLPDSVYMLEAVPHDWLFPQVAAVIHHGGAGTTAAGLRAGKPTFIAPFLADQPFWGQRVYALGVGPAPVAQKQLTRERLAAAIRQMTTDSAMQARAAQLGALIRAEDGVGNAVQIIRQALGEPVTA